MTQPIRLFEGMGVALITPFQADGSVDYVSLQTLLEHIISGGADFVVVLRGSPLVSLVMNVML